MNIKHEIILDFLNDWLDWAEKGGSSTENNCFYLRYWGLCSNLGVYLEHHHEGYDDLYDDVMECFSVEMLGSRAFPFGEQDYDLRASNNTQHKCPTRLLWVREKIEELEKEKSNAL